MATDMGEGKDEGDVLQWEMVMVGTRPNLLFQVLSVHLPGGWRVCEYASRHMRDDFHQLERPGIPRQVVLPVNQRRLRTVAAG